MKTRPLCIATVFYMIGIIMGLYIQKYIVFLLCITIIILLYICKKIRYVILIFVLMLGFISIKIVDNNYINQYKLKEEESYHIKAVVVSEIESKEYKDTYEIKIYDINTDKKCKGKKWILNIKKSKKNKLSYGDLIEFDGKIEIPSVSRNYKGFDYQKYLKSQNIYGNIILENNLKVIAKNKSNFMDKIVHNVSTDIKNKIYQLLPEESYAICLGILTGNRTDITKQITEDFQNSNLTHMLAISGAHISYIIIGLSFILSKTGNKFRKISIILFLIFFMNIAKFTPSVQRASFMAIFVIIASLFHQKADVYTNLAISLLIILINNPYSILDIGLQLSYGGTIGIILFNDIISNWIYKKLKNYEKIKHIIDMFIVTISANIIIIPIMAINFNTISFTFWISNILAGPFLGIIIILGFITYIISIFSIKLASFTAFFLKYIIRIFIIIAKTCAKLPFSSVLVTTPSIIEISIYYLFIYLVFNYKNLKEKIQAVYKKQSKNVLVTILIITLSFNFIGIIKITNSSLKIYFIDVGQGDSTLIKTNKNKTILIDGGGSELNTDFDVGEKTLLPYLLDRKIKKINYMIISHFDSDHVGGLLYLLEHINVDNVIISKQGENSQNYIKFKEIINKKNIKVIIVGKGDRIKIEEDIYFDILWPNKSELINENILNNNSIVCKLCYKNFSMLFTGDIEEIAENQ